MICLKCENEEFEKKNVQIEQEFEGRIVCIVTKAMVCINCGFVQFDDNQANELIKKVRHE